MLMKTYHTYGLWSRPPVGVCMMAELTHRWVGEWDEPPSSGNGKGEEGSCTSSLLSKLHPLLSLKAEAGSWADRSSQTTFLLSHHFWSQQSRYSHTCSSQGLTLGSESLEVLPPDSNMERALQQPSLQLTVLRDCDWYHCGVTHVEKDQMLPLVSEILGLGDSCF